MLVVLYISYVVLRTPVRSDTGTNPNWPAADSTPNVFRADS